MNAEAIREGDIVEIDYIAEFTKEHINEGKALVIWKGNNNQPLVRKLSTKKTIWTCYEHIAKIVGHIDIEDYMDGALSAEPCEDAISRDCDKCAYYDDGANDEACDGCFADEYEHPNFKPKAQHCEDCISRQAVLNILFYKSDNNGEVRLSKELQDRIKNLPPVTPKEKTGKWIPLGNHDEWGNENSYKCSECGERNFYPDNYCHNCGAKMVEDREK